VLELPQRRVRIHEQKTFEVTEFEVTQAVIEQFALDPLLVLAALRHLIGAAADQQGAAQGGAPQGSGVSLEHDFS